MQRERIKAQSALKDIQKIEELINNASIQARETERVLNGSEGNAKSAREIAQNAQVRLLKLIFKSAKLLYNEYILIFFKLLHFSFLLKYYNVIYKVYLKSSHFIIFSDSYTT